MLATPKAQLGLRLLFGLALIGITGLGVAPLAAPLPPVPIADKWAHLLAYLVLAMLLDLGWPKGGFDWRKWTLLLGHGIAIELVQSQLPNRFASLGDIVANTAGVALYALALQALLRRLAWR
jgi:VanZ family protein